jgi:hypothetical protein
MPIYKKHFILGEAEDFYANSDLDAKIIGRTDPGCNSVKRWDNGAVIYNVFTDTFGDIMEARIKKRRKGEGKSYISNLTI